MVFRASYYEGWYNSNVSYFFLRNCRLIMKFTYIVSMSFTELKLFVHKLFIINILFLPLNEMLYASHIKHFAEALELITQAIFQHCPQNGVLRMLPSGGQKDGSQRVPNR
jgi:hypothetical protein